MSVALEQLLTLVDEEGRRAARLGYVLGYHRAEHGQYEEIEEGSPEHRFLTDMHLIEPGLW